MNETVFNFTLNLNWSLISLISNIDRFDASWTSLERTENKSLRELKFIATVRSVGASTRIEGSALSDEEVDVLLNNIDINKLEDRDAQEVVGYFEALDLISETYNDIQISEGDIKNLHNILMRYSAKDVWHKGNYKQHSNAVEARYIDGTKQIIFKTTEPGIDTEIAMQNLFNWYATEQAIHPLVKCSIFTYEFLSIHPFQDGNGRLSRLISALLLLKSGYKWIQYVSFEHEIENRKLEYYRTLRTCQAQRPNENINDWVLFFLDALKNIQVLLLQKLQQYQKEGEPLLPREKLLVAYIQNHPGCKSGDMVKSLGISKPIVIRLLKDLVGRNIIEKHGHLSATQYTIL
jgi:Fic family protein